MTTKSATTADPSADAMRQCMRETAARIARAIKARQCGMCFGTGQTRRYRGPDRKGPCLACDGTGQKSGHMHGASSKMGRSSSR